MRTILIAQRSAAFSNQLASELRQSGYHIIDCPGPWPAQRCIRCDVGYCPLTEGANLMIYDPFLTGEDQSGERYNLAADSARAHPGIPMLLAWSPDEEVPDVGTLRALRSAAPQMHIMAHSHAERLDQIRDLLEEGVVQEHHVGASRAT